MRQTILLCILLTFNIAAQATECVDRVFQEDKVNMYLCQNYSNYNETTSLLFKARTKVLNEYINEKIRSGQLEDKKFEIQIYDQVLTYRHLELTQGKNGYFVNLSGYPTLEQLVILIDYFTKPDWEPFLTSDYTKVSDEILANQIDKFYADNASVNLPILTQNTFPVWAQGDLHLDYEGDDLKYFVGSTPLSIKATSSLPVLIKDRFLLFQSDTMYVLQGQEIIVKMKIDNPISEDYDIYAYPNWVNICNGGKDNWVYSYSYKRNKFYKRNGLRNWLCRYWAAKNIEAKRSPNPQSLPLHLKPIPIRQKAKAAAHFG